MKSRLLARIFAACLAAVTAAAPSARAAPPAYLLLRTPAAPTSHRPAYGYYPGYGIGVETQTYSYGWFGVRPRRHWSRHSGYYRNYTEWSAR